MSDDSHGAGHGDAPGHGAGSHGSGHVDDGQRQAIIFVGILAGAAAFLLLLFGTGVPLPLIILLAGALVVLAAFFPRIRTIPETERAVVYVFGKYSHVIGPGLHWYIPFVHTITHVDMRTQTVDTKPQPVVTTDTIRILIDTIIYWRVTDARKFATQAREPATAMTQIVLSQTRNVVSRMTLQEVLERTNEINADLQHVLEEVADQWGVQVQKVEVQRIELPPELVEAFRKKREAEENKSRVEIEAKARQVQLEILEQAASQMSDKTLAYLYLDALKKISEGKSNKLIFPLELSHLASSLSGQLAGAHPSKHHGGGGGVNYEAVLSGLLSAYTQREAKLLDANSPNPAAVPVKPDAKAALVPVVTGPKESQSGRSPFGSNSNASQADASGDGSTQTTLKPSNATPSNEPAAKPDAPSNAPPWVSRGKPGVRFKKIDASEHPTADLAGLDDE